MIEADSTVRKTVARLIASFQISALVPSRLQCSVARIWAAYGPNGCWPATAAVAVAAPAGARSGTADAASALLGSWLAIVDLLEVAGERGRCAHSVGAGCHSSRKGRRWC